MEKKTVRLVGGGGLQLVREDLIEKVPYSKGGDGAAFHLGPKGRTLCYLNRPSRKHISSQLHAFEE
jgi:hypothetical protein